MHAIGKDGKPIHTQAQKDAIAKVESDAAAQKSAGPRVRNMPDFQAHETRLAAARLAAKTSQ